MVSESVVSEGCGGGCQVRHVHLVKVRFDRRRLDITDEWLENRFEFFIANTLRSLEDQIDKDFSLWLQFGKGIEGTLVDRFKERLFSHNINTRYHGRHALHVYVSMGDGPYHLPPEVRQGIAYVYVTRIDSDDLFAPDAVQIINDQFPKVYGDVECLIFRRGYMHDIRMGETVTYYNRSSPFHTIIFPMGVFTDPNEYTKIWSKTGDHSRVSDALDGQVLPDWKFAVLIHGDNFISTFSYGREKGQCVPVGWSIDNFLQPPVVFDVDDFSDEYGGRRTLDDVVALRERYPHFKCTLFTIPSRTHHSLVTETRSHKWIELAVHGWQHRPVEELKSLSPDMLAKYLGTSVVEGYAKVFRPPGWYITTEHVRVLTKLGYAIALHKRDAALIPECTRGHYIVEERWPYWHGHTHDVCGNYLHAHLPELLEKWNKDQRFAFVSEAVLKKT